ncbi:hypothetical protein [Myxococcus landrumensis]|uniref:Lipoprotein n=1 Tax=Myxococcus landrumensis TaxID=2813577 RepID=A0ABX7N619_9BACT|nr:hypothetical protein [Myxococcus landrumus]QSQ14073.1 hypothetical protein JY572_38125 [Myxococcus landrumus]
MVIDKCMHGVLFHETCTACDQINREFSEEQGRRVESKEQKASDAQWNAALEAAAAEVERRSNEALQDINADQCMGTDSATFAYLEGKVDIGVESMLAIRALKREVKP